MSAESTYREFVLDDADVVHRRMFHQRSHAVCGHRFYRIWWTEGWEPGNYPACATCAAAETTRSLVLWVSGRPMAPSAAAEGSRAARAALKDPAVSRAARSAATTAQRSRKKKRIISTAEWAAEVRAQEAAVARRARPITVVSGGLPSLGKRR